MHRTSAYGSTVHLRGFNEDILKEGQKVIMFSLSHIKGEIGVSTALQIQDNND